MPFVSPEELASLRGARDLVPVLTDRCNSFETALRESEAALAALRAALSVDDARRARVAEAMELLSHPESVVSIGLREEVVAELAEKDTRVLEETVRAGLIAEHDSKVQEHVVVTKGPQIRAELDELFKVDGTYARIDEQAERKVGVVIAADLRHERERQIEAELEDPARRAIIIAKQREALDGDPGIAKYRAAIDERVHEQAGLEAEQLEMAAAEQSVLARQPEIVEDQRRRFRESYRGKQTLQNIEYRTEERIRQITDEELAETTESEGLRDALQKKAELREAEIHRENRAKELALAFTNGGVETGSIPEGTVIKIKLGLLESYEKDEYVSGVWKKVKHPRLVTNRVLSLTANGDGMFRVDHDSLRDSKNMYAAAAGLPEGAVIAVGMLVSSGRDSAGQPRNKLLALLKAGATLHYDTDITTPEDFHSTGLFIGDLIVDGIAARGFESETEKLL